MTPMKTAMAPEKKKNGPPFDLAQYLDDKRRMINRRLGSLLDAYSASSRLDQAMHYSLMGDGKRIRPVLSIAAAEAVGAEETEPVLRTACAVEMIHAYSLIHDDLPALDNDDTRRGRPTCHVRFDEATALLAGDALLTLAFEIISDADAGFSDSPVQLAVVRKIAKAAGNRGMIEGQMRDMIAEGKAMEPASLKRIHELKTGAVIGASVTAGAIAGGGADDQVSALSEYAANIGLAFQVADDLLNVEGDPQIMGKSAGTDALHQKATYPGLLGVEASRKYAGDLVSAALDSLAIFGDRAMPLHAIARYIVERKR